MARPSRALRSLSTSRHSPDDSTQNNKRTHDDANIDDSNGSDSDEDIPARVPPTANALEPGAADAEPINALFVEEDVLNVIEALNATVHLQQDTVDSMITEPEISSPRLKINRRQTITKTHKLSRPSSSTGRSLRSKRTLDFHQQSDHDPTGASSTRGRNVNATSPKMLHAPERSEYSEPVEIQGYKHKNVLRNETQIEGAAKDIGIAVVDRSLKRRRGQQPKAPKEVGVANTAMEAHPEVVVPPESGRDQLDTLQEDVDGAEELAMPHEQSVGSTESRDNSGETEQEMHPNHNGETAPFQYQTQEAIDIVEWLQAKLVEMVTVVKPKVRKIPTSDDGKLILRAIKELCSRYKRIEEICSADPLDPAALTVGNEELQESFGKYSGIVAFLSSGCLSAEDAGGEESKKRLKSILEVLYFQAVPDIVKLLQIAVKTRTKNGNILPAALLEIKELSESLNDLVERAKSISKTSQAPIQKHIIQLAPLIGSFVKYCEKELPRLDKAVWLAELKFTAPKREKKRKEELALSQQREEAESRKRKREWDRRQALWKKNIAESGLHLYGTQQTGADADSAPAENTGQLTGRQQEMDQIRETLHNTHKQVQELKKEIEQAEEKIKRAEKHFARLMQVSEEEGDVLRDPFAEERADSRPHMSGEKSISKALQEKSWTMAEMEIMLDGLQQNQGPDRYEIISKHLDRSLEEIFAWAKKFKTTMEDEYLQRQQQNPGRRLPPLEGWIKNIE